MKYFVISVVILAAVLVMSKTGSSATEEIDSEIQIARQKCEIIIKIRKCGTRMICEVMTNRDRVFLHQSPLINEIIKCD